jgi:hypothetical protein
MLTAAVRPPRATGVKVTAMVQLRSAASELPQLLVCAKSAASAPVMARFAMIRIPRPTLFTYMARAALVVPVESFPNERLAGERVSAGAMPVPVRATDCLPL